MDGTNVNFIPTPPHTPHQRNTNQRLPEFWERSAIAGVEIQECSILKWFEVGGRNWGPASIEEQCRTVDLLL